MRKNVKVICISGFECTFGIFKQDEKYQGIDYINDEFVNDLVIVGGTRFTRETFNNHFKLVFKYGK